MKLDVHLFTIDIYMSRKFQKIGLIVSEIQLRTDRRTDGRTDGQGQI